MAQAKAAKNKQAAQKKTTTGKKKTAPKKPPANKKTTTAKKSTSKKQPSTSKRPTARQTAAMALAKTSTSKKATPKKAAPKKIPIAPSKSKPTLSRKTGGSKPANKKDTTKPMTTRSTAEQTRLKPSARSISKQSASAPSVPDVPTAPGRQPDLVLRADDPHRRSRSDWRTRSGNQPPLAADDRQRSRGSTFKMTASKLVPFEEDTVEVGIRFPNPKGLLRRLFGGEEPIHEHRVSWILTGGGDTTSFETALTDFLESFGYQFDSTEAAVEGRARCSVYYGRERNRQAACRNAHQALRGALAQTTGRVSPSAARAAEELVTTLAQYSSGLVELDGLMLVRISDGGRAHVTVKLVAEV